MMIERARKLVLGKAWDVTCAKLIVKYKKMNKKHRELATKIGNINFVHRIKILDEYYYNAKVRYLYNLNKWLSTRKKNKANCLGMPKNTIMTRKSNKNLFIEIPKYNELNSSTKKLITIPKSNVK